MSKKNTDLNIRWFYLIIGVISMLFAGVLYAWSILKTPLTNEFGWSASQLALNFTIAMSFFCIGGLLGAQISKRAGHKIALIMSGILSALGFILTASLHTSSIIWFPDKKGLCSGCLMMGFGASALILGNIANALFNSNLGWRSTYIYLGIAICAVLVLAVILLQKPSQEITFPEQKSVRKNKSEEFEPQDYTSLQMLSRPSFWLAFICISFLAAVGSSVISFAKDLALSVNAPESLAVSLVGVLSICNGFGRILTGALFDSIGRRKTMICSNILTIGAAAVTLLAVYFGSLPLCITGLCLTGMSYGACPTITSAFTSSIFGMKYFSTNMAFMTFTVMGGSLIATASNKMLEITGGYTSTFIMLLALSSVALVLNTFIRKP